MHRVRALAGHSIDVGTEIRFQDREADTLRLKGAEKIRHQQGRVGNQGHVYQTLRLPRLFDKERTMSIEERQENTVRAALKSAKTSLMSVSPDVIYNL